MLDPQLKVILEVLAHALKLVKHLDIERLEHVTTTDSGHLEQGRRVIRASREHDLSLRLDSMRLPFGVFILDANRSLAVQQHPLRRRVQSDGQVLPGPHLRAEKRVGRAPALRSFMLTCM